MPKKRSYSSQNTPKIFIKNQLRMTTVQLMTTGDGLILRVGLQFQEFCGLKMMPFFLIPDAKSDKLLPQVIGPKYGYARKINKMLFNKGIDYSGIPKPGSEIRGKFINDIETRWEREFFTKLLGSDEAIKLLKNKPEVVKINVVAKIKNILTTVECDTRLYGADIVEIRLPQDTSKRLLAKSSTPKFQGC